MKIAFVEIQNFRKLKSCRIEFDDKITLFVGANNSGKTSAMDTLIQFLGKQRRFFSTTDFTLSNWEPINEIGQYWVDDNNPDLSLEQWHKLIPILDVWLTVNNSEIHHISGIIPTLSWGGGFIGVRLAFEPHRLDNLYKDFRLAFEKAKSKASQNNGSSDNELTFWPTTLQHFLEKRLNEYFKVTAYLLNPEGINEPSEGLAQPQNLPDNSYPLDFNPFDGLIKIDIIEAQRGYSEHKNSDNFENNRFNGLSTQLRKYYDKHLNPTDSPDTKDIEALIALEKARKDFDERLKTSFSSALSELQDLGYPGFTDPRITISTKINLMEGINHDSAVQYEIGKNNGKVLSLPEKYNGLGYQNLISMVFKLMSFRDAWMRIGRNDLDVEKEGKIEPLHIVLIEEPEAHLHAQAQQVFIKKAYNVLRNNENLGDADIFTTQLIVSTHSSHIAHEAEFSCLRYFKRKPISSEDIIPYATVINLSETFGKEDETSKFATRYLRTTHCDLFFADGVILIEGAAERIFMPHFIRHKYKKLDSRYISIMEIGGRHAFRLKPLIENLGIITLIITDIDSCKLDTTSGKRIWKKCIPKLSEEQKTSNPTLKNWLPMKDDLDELLGLDNEKKLSHDNNIRVAYQYPFSIEYSDSEKDIKVIPYTFEDALAFTNIKLFKGLDTETALLRQIKLALSKPTCNDAMDLIHNELNVGSKAEMALELLYCCDPKDITLPHYIADGLQWMSDELAKVEVESLKAVVTNTQE